MYKRQNLEDRLEDRNIRISYGEDLIGRIWEDRPALSAQPAWVLAEQYAGKCSKEKIADVREAMKKAHATVHVPVSYTHLTATRLSDFRK